MQFRLGKNENGEGSRRAFQIGGTRSADGVALRTFDTAPGGVGAPEGPPLVLLNGLGGPFQVWDPLIPYLGDRFRLLSWDYRGLYGSSVRSPDVRLDVASHAEDLGQVLRQAGEESAHLVAWSMGVQVALEAIRRLPEGSVASLTLMNGNFGRPLRGLGLPVSARWTGRIARGARILSGRGLPFAEWLADSPLPHQVLTRLGVLARGVERAHLQTMMRQFRELDGAVYARLLHELSVHDAEAVLRQIRCPTLVIGGSADTLTPPHFARRIATEIPGAEHFVVAGGTHYAPIEVPRLIADRLLTFLETHPHPPVPRVRFTPGAC